MPRLSKYPDLLDEVPILSVSILKKFGYLKPGETVSGTVIWSTWAGVGLTLNVTASVSEGFVRLEYRCYGRLIIYRIKLEKFAARLGGHYWMFICPVMGTRCHKVYCVGDYFLSRAAHPKAIYSIQAQSKRQREVENAYRSILNADEHLHKWRGRRTYKGQPTKRYRCLSKNQAKYANEEALKRLLERSPDESGKPSQNASDSHQELMRLSRAESLHRH